MYKSQHKLGYWNQLLQPAKLTTINFPNANFPNTNFILSKISVDNRTHLHTFSSVNFIFRQQKLDYIKMTTSPSHSTRFLHCSTAMNNFSVYQLNIRCIQSCRYKIWLFCSNTFPDPSVSFLMTLQSSS